jgi:signal transduction histidine kinase
MRSAESNMRQSGYGYYFREAGGADPLSPGTPRERFIYWPVIQGERTVALLEVSGDNCGVDMVPLLRPYADEVSAAIRDAAAQMGPISASIESDMAGIDLRLQTVGSPEEALKVLVSECCRLTNSLTGVVRYRDEDDAVILRLEIPDYSSYERVAAPRHSLSHPWSWSARTIVSGQENIVDIAHHREIIMKSRKRLSEQQREAVKDVGSMCFQPLLLDGRCIGSLGLHARAPVNYTEEKVRIARLVARRAALALHDYLVAQETARQVEDAQAETVRLILHNIHNPLATIRTELDRLAKEVSRSELDREALAGQVAMLTRQAERIARVREEYLRLQKPWESRIEPADIHELLRTATNEWTAGHGEVTVSYDLASHLRNVRIDCSAIEVCLGVLIQNSLDALQSGNLAKAITIRLRSPTKEEVALLGGPGPGLAVDVTDSGPGVPPGVANSLFKIISSGKAKGLGFGLSYCRRVARSAQGDVYHHQNYQGGARFTVLLPFTEVRRKEAEWQCQSTRRR